MPIIDYLKSNVTMFYGYNDGETMVAMMQRMSAFVRSKGYKMKNMDKSKFDTNISPELRIQTMFIEGAMLKTALGHLINEQSVL